MKHRFALIVLACCFFQVHLWGQYPCEEFKSWLESSNEINLYSDIKCQENRGFVIISIIFNDYSDIERIWKAHREQWYVLNRSRLEEYIYDRAAYIGFPDYAERNLKITFLYNETQVIEIKSINSRLVVDYNWGDIPMGSGTVAYDIGNINPVFLDVCDTVTNVKVMDLRRRVSEWLISYYKERGTPVIYKSRIDTSRTYYNEIVYDISHISNEVIDEGYFELIRVKVKFEQIGDKVLLVYTIMGKYGSGIFRPPSSSEYKLMEPKFSVEMSDYEEFLIKKISSLFTNYRY